MYKFNCPNCGAIITGDICEYCDTRFNKFNEIGMNLNLKDSIQKIKIGNYEFEAYISKCEVKNNKLFNGDKIGRDMYGRLHITNSPVYIPEITLKLISTGTTKQPITPNILL